MLTSYYAGVKSIPAGMKPIGISQGPPAWWRGPNEKRLAPSWAMLKMPRSDYDILFRQILAALDPAEMYEAVGGDKAVLLCWEAPNVWCHRRAVAEWFEEHLKIVVPEVGLRREESLPYAQMPSKVEAQKAASKRTAKKPAAPEVKQELPGSFQRDFFGGGNEE